MGEQGTVISSSIGCSDCQGSKLRLSGTGSGNAWRRGQGFNSCNRNSHHGEGGSEELHIRYMNKEVER